MVDSLRNLTLDYVPGIGLSGPVSPDVQHLTIDSKAPLSLSVSLINGLDAQGNEILPHYEALIIDPKTTKVMAHFGLSPNLQDITIDYTDASGVHKDAYSPYSASQLRLQADVGLISACIDDFRRTDPNRSAQDWYPTDSSVYEYGYRMSDIPSSTLAFMQKQLLRDRNNASVENPFVDVALAETTVGLGIQQYEDSLGPGPINLAEKNSAEINIENAQNYYYSAIRASQNLGGQLPNALSLDLTPHEPADFLDRRLPPTNPTSANDYWGQTFESVIDTSNWRRRQLNDILNQMSANAQLPPRQSAQCDLP